ncbi:hypothetical protein EDB84DRAFT_1447039 [Lactarius hengduanensis]|nr:hypothetical protein EDB84DRAFT_1447039 [Lactarius hengduanensis]
MSASHSSSTRSRVHIFAFVPILSGSHSHHLGTVPRSLPHQHFLPPSFLAPSGLIWPVKRIAAHHTVHTTVPQAAPQIGCTTNQRLTRWSRSRSLPLMMGLNSSALFHRRHLLVYPSFAPLSTAKPKVTKHGHA